MSDQASIAETVRDKWVWFLILGIVLVLCGLFAMSMPLASSWAVTWIVGWALIVAGIFQIIQAFSVSSWGGFIWQLLLGIVMVVGGFLVLANPLAAMMSVTLVIAVTFLVQGVFQIIMSFQLRPESGWGWILVSGILSVVVGLMIFSRFPFSAAYAPGVLAGISIFFNGITYIAISLAARSAPPSSTAAA